MTEKQAANNIFKIVIVDDHKMFLNGIEAILKSIKNIEVVRSYNDPLVLLENLKVDSPDLVITDISMPNMNGIDLMKKIRLLCPEVKIMVLSMHSEAAIVKTILKGQPEGYLLKNTDQDELFLAITAIREGSKYYSPAIQTILINDIQGGSTQKPSMVPVLSPREKEVLILITKEFTTQEIATQLFLSANTVETYRQNLLRKLDAKNSAGIVAKAYQFGLI